MFLSKEVKGNRWDNRDPGLKGEDMWWFAAASAPAGKQRITSSKVYVKRQAVWALNWYRSEVKKSEEKER